MSEAPSRHPGVPPEAVWRWDLDKWEVVATDAAGNRQGPSRLYREDGTLYKTVAFADGVEDGGFEIFHPSGAVARKGRLVAGELDGDIVATVDAGGQGEPLRSCCVPEPAVEMRSLFERGQLVYERFYDDRGRLLLSDGGLCPDRPAGLPERADYDEGTGRWMIAPDRTAGERFFRHHRQDGSLAEESVIEDGWKTFERRYDREGSVAVEFHSSKDGRKHGDFYRRFDAGDDPVASPYLDARIRQERGQFVADRPVGRWTFLDESGAVVRTVDHGRWGNDGSLPPVSAEIFVNEARPPEFYRPLAERMAAEGQVGLALVAAARAAARSGQIEDLVSLLASHTVPLQADPAVELAAKTSELIAAQSEPNFDPRIEVLRALVGGGDPSDLLRTLSGLVRDQPRASVDLAEAAILLAPERPTGYLARALARVELGDDRGALADASRLEPVSTESTAFLRSYVKAVFPSWDFWPSADVAASGFSDEVIDGVPSSPGQPLDAIRRMIQIYATRLSLLRVAVLVRAPHRDRAAWLPPALPDLLPTGPLALGVRQETITDETDEGTETVTVEIDETLPLEGLGLPTLMRLARGQWAALTWLLWAVGQRQVALPTAIEPPEVFASAAVAAITRYFRVQDAVMTGGLRARTNGVPSFAFHGVDVDELPGPVAEIALEESRELRSLFLWLLSPENHSPFQSDLRDESAG